MSKKYTPATFQPTIRPSWAGILSYIDANEKAEILDAIICFPNERLGGVKSRFYNETIKPDLTQQYEKFVSTCEQRGRGAKTYWGEHKLSISNTSDKQKDNLLKDKDKDKVKVKIKDKVKYNHYGELNNVWLTEEDYNKLLSLHPDLSYAIEKLDGWLDTKNGEKNKNRNHRCYFKSDSWVWDRGKNQQSERKKTQAELIDEHNLSYIEKIMEEQYNG